MEKRIIAYFDGSNFYHLALKNYGVKGLDFEKMTRELLSPEGRLVKIRYFNAPVNQQEEPEMYREQQRFFARLRSNPIIDVQLGKLARRSLDEIWIKCDECGLQLARDVNCPKCARLMFLDSATKTVEKGVDVKLAITLLLDAITDRYDSALLFSSDADFVPVIRHVIGALKKEVIYCHFPEPFTGDLVKACSRTLLIKKEMLVKHQA